MNVRNKIKSEYNENKILYWLLGALLTLNIMLLNGARANVENELSNKVNEDEFSLLYDEIKEVRSAQKETDKKITDIYKYLLNKKDEYRSK